jgi:hypothetical protein
MAAIRSPSRSVLPHSGLSAHRPSSDATRRDLFRVRCGRPITPEMVVALSAARHRLCAQALACNVRDALRLRQRCRETRLRVPSRSTRLTATHMQGSIVQVTRTVARRVIENVRHGTAIGITWLGEAWSPSPLASAITPLARARALELPAARRNVARDCSDCRAERQR